MSSSPPLLGLDHFMLALERNDTSTGTSGHTCRYILELDGEFDLNNFKILLQENEIAQWLSSLHISSSLLQSNKWTSGEKKDILIEEIISDEIIPQNLAQTILHKENSPLFFFSILRGAKTRLVFSWHHLLMDGYGAVLFIENIIAPLERHPIERKKSKLSFPILKECIKAKKFVDSTSKGEIETMENLFTKNVAQAYRFISFSAEESLEIEKNALKNGARFGISSYYLACTSIVVAQHLAKKNKRTTKDFWIPVPQSTRKKGSKWPVTGNHLSFLFYRINAEYFRNKLAMT